MNFTRFIRDRARHALWAVLLLVGGLAGCSSDGGEDPMAGPLPVPVATGTVSGVVASSADGAPLAGVAVAVAIGGRTATTGADGRYTLTEVPSGFPAVIAFTLPGYVKGFSNVSVPEAGVANASPRLVPVAATQTFDATAGATVTVAGSPARVALPAGGLVTSSGAAASGAVTALVTPINPAADPSSMPGNYTALPPGGGALERIESFGALNVTLRDAAGNALNLAPGRTSTIRIPLATRSVSAPATIPLYSFNETTGIWVADGTATMQGTAPNQYYEGTVSHFSTWNADQPQQTIQVVGCVQDANAARVAGVTLSSIGVDYSGIGEAVSAADGSFRLPMRRGGTATVSGQRGQGSTNVLRAGPSDTDITLPSCLVLGTGPLAPQIVQQPASIAVVAGQYAYFFVQAVGTPSLRYRWQRNGVDIPNAVASVYLIAAAQVADDGARYSVIIGNEAGNVTSQTAVLNVAPVVVTPPVIGTEPADRTVTLGDTAGFSVVVQSQGGTLSFQWLRNGVAIAGANAASYTTPATVAGDDGALFSVVVTSSNATSVTSVSARLSVVVPTGVVITRQPAAASVNVGQSATFSVTATGSPPLGYQWRRNGVDITGANVSSYTTPATTLADSGALYSVRVANGVDARISSDAALTVQNAGTTGGYHLVASAGPSAAGTVTYANGTLSIDSPALLAINAAAPGNGAYTLEDGGQVASIGTSLLSATVTNNTLGNVRQRYTVYAKAGRFYKFDHVVASGTPQSQLWTTLRTNDVCGQGGLPELFDTGEVDDFSDAQRTWVFLRAPGPDGRCDTADDTARALRAGMTGTSDAVALSGVPLIGIYNASGAITGYIVQSGNLIRRVDAELQPVADLYTVSGNFTDLGVAFGSSLPGVWVFVDGSKLYGVNLAAPATRTELATLAGGETVGEVVPGESGAAYVTINTSTAARVLRLNEALTSSAVLSFASPVTSLSVTPTRLVVLLRSGAVQTVPKAGGTPLAVYTRASNFESASLAYTAGENLYIPVVTLAPGASSPSARLLVVNSDGSNVQSLGNTSVVGAVFASDAPLNFGVTDLYALLVASPVRNALDQSGATVRAIEGSTRNALVSYGALPNVPAGIAIAGLAGPLQYGQPGLLSYIDTGSGTAAGTGDLYFFNSGAAGLLKITNFLIPGSRAEPSRVGQARPLAVPAAAPGRRASWLRPSGLLPSELARGVVSGRSGSR